MKLSYLQSIDPCDPLPKLGRKVEPKKPDPGKALRLELSRFECDRCPIDDLDAAISTAVKAAAAHVGTDTFVKAMSSTGTTVTTTKWDEPTASLVVSFADWIKWDGGECPVSDQTEVEVRHRDGATDKGQAGGWKLCWTNDDCSADIIAYRVIKPAAEKKEVSFDDVLAARDAAYSRGVHCQVVNQTFSAASKLPIIMDPSCWPAAIAALEALR